MHNSSENNNQRTQAPLKTFLIILLGFLFIVLSMVKPYLLAVVMGGILALLAYPIQRRLMRRGLSARKSALTVTFGVIFLVLAPLLTFSTLAIKQGIVFAEFISQTQGFSLDKVINFFVRWEPLAALFDAAEIEQQVHQTLQAIGSAASSVVLSLAKSIPEGSLQLVLICLTCYFMLVDGPKFLIWAYARIPLAADVRVKLVEAFQETAISVIWATMAAALTQAVIMVIAFLVLGVPAAFLAGGLTFIFAFIPFAGSVPVWLGGALFLLLKGNYIYLAIMIGFGVFTSTIDNFVRPWILKGRNEMHPLVALISIFGGINMFGLFGVFLGPILAAVVITLLQIWPVLGRRYGVEFDSGADIKEIITKV